MRRWALRELKVHPGQVVVVAGCPVTGILPVLRGLVAADGAVLVYEADPRRAARAAARVHERGWSNVAVVPGPPDRPGLPRRADRVLIDGYATVAAAEVLAHLLGLLEPGGRLAAVCRRGSPPCAHLRDRMPGLRRESFYGGTAYALWGQIP